VKLMKRSLLPAVISAALLAGSAWADEQRECEEIEGTPPGLYTTTDEGKTFLFKDGKIVEMAAGESGYANEGEVKCIKKPPAFLDWPCSTQAAQSRLFATYTVEDLKSNNPMKEIVERYFKVPEVLMPIPNWIDGEYNAIFNYHDIIQFSSPDYWYFPDDNHPVLSSPKRPRSLLISLFVGTNQVVIDNNMIDALRKELGTDDLPVAFIFNDSNAVPISYFGANVSLEEVFKAFTERGIKVADVPQWWLGDYHLKPTIAEFEKFFDIPALEDIDPAKVEALRQDLESHGFSRKSIIVSMFAESESMAVDQPERIRVAASMGYDRIPTSFSFIEQDAHLARCGPGTPSGTSGVSGASTPIGGATVPTGATGSTVPVGETGAPLPPPDEPEASGS
jgi:hypothetical protein